MNKYEVLGVIDEGAYGTVMKASVRDTDAYVAIKKFKESDEDPAVRSTIQREIRMLKALRSEFVVDLKEAFRKKGKVYLVFEFMEKNLLQLIQDHPSGIPLHIVQRLTTQIVQCLHFLHSKDVLHRDLKPENLLISSKLTLKLCDFGFTRTYHSPDEELTDYVATRWYRSPELLVGEKYGKALDMWSMGCIVFEMVTGEPLFPGENQIDQIHLIRKCMGELTMDQKNRMKATERFNGVKFPEIRKLDPIEAKLYGRAPKNVVEFIKDCLNMDPNKRLTAAEALSHPYIANVTVNTLKPQSPNEHRQYTAPLIKRDSEQMNKKNFKTKTIYNSKSNDNVWKFAGAGRIENTKPRKILKSIKQDMPQLHLTVTQLNNTNSIAPDSSRNYLKDGIKTYVKAKMSLNTHDTEHSQNKPKSFRLTHYKMKSLVNVFCKSETTKARTDNFQMDFTVSGQMKQMSKKL